MSQRVIDAKQVGCRHCGEIVLDFSENPGHYEVRIKIEPLWDDAALWYSKDLKAVIHCCDRFSQLEARHLVEGWRNT